MNDTRVFYLSEPELQQFSQLVILRDNWLTAQREAAVHAGISSPSAEGFRAQAQENKRNLDELLRTAPENVRQAYYALYP